MQFETAVFVWLGSSLGIVFFPELLCKLEYLYLIGYYRLLLDDVEHFDGILCVIQCT